jgi:hypothetical protein
MSKRGVLFPKMFQPLSHFSLDLTQNKRRKDNLSTSAFLLSIDLRDYPLKSSGFVPFGVQVKGLDLSRIQ